MTVDEYLAGAPEPQRSTLEALRRSLRSILPNAEEGLSYGVPAFRLSGRAVAGYAYYKAHCSFFPHSGTVLEAIEEELGDYAWSKGTLRFPVDEVLPASLLERLVRERMRQLGLGE